MRQGGPKRWFEDSDDEDNENKWEYMEHHGVMFPEPYFAKGLSITYGGVRIKYPRDYVVCKNMKRNWPGTGRSPLELITKRVTSTVTTSWRRSLRPSRRDRGP